MKSRNILPFIVLSGCLLGSCYDTKMEWYNPHEGSEVGVSELPLSDEEKLERYDVLKAYIPRPDFVIGLGMGMDFYVDDEAYKAIVDANFNSVTLGNAMKMGSIVKADGSRNFEPVDEFIQMLPQDIALYGHNLIWHTQQAASYLNSLIAPEYVETGNPDEGRDNLLLNGNFDADISSWSKYNGADGCNTWNSEEGNRGKGCLQVVNANDNEGGQWKTQIHADLSETIPAGKTFYISYYIKTTGGTGSVRMSTANGNSTINYQGDQAVNTNWNRIQWEVTSDSDINGVNIDLGLKAATYLIDDIVVSLDSFDESGAVIEKTDEEKKQILTQAMHEWITDMVTHYKDRVHSWDVLNEPIDDGGKLRGVEVMPDESEMDGDDFYWGHYIGKDYAVLAFKYAREADPSAKLYVNDYNLEYNLDKCDKLIEYVNYIDQNGATVDGIGTQMHIDITINKDNIVSMFQKLAETGKLIRITELDVKVNTASPTDENLKAQQEIYEYVIDTYKEIIPEAQQGGITIWTLSDHPDEHVYWIPDDAPNLWNADYERKPAYMGVANGLAGREVSEDFTGDLRY